MKIGDDGFKFHVRINELKTIYKDKTMIPLLKWNHQGMQKRDCNNKHNNHKSIWQLMKELVLTIITISTRHITTFQVHIIKTY